MVISYWIIMQYFPVSLSCGWIITISLDSNILHKYFLICLQLHEASSFLCFSAWRWLDLICCDSATSSNTTYPDNFPLDGLGFAWPFPLLLLLEVHSNLQVNITHSININIEIWKIWQNCHLSNKLTHWLFNEHLVHAAASRKDRERETHSEKCPAKQKCHN